MGYLSIAEAEAERENMTAKIISIMSIAAFTSLLLFPRNKNCLYRNGKIIDKIGCGGRI